MISRTNTRLRVISWCWIHVFVLNGLTYFLSLIPTALGPKARSGHRMTCDSDGNLYILGKLIVLKQLIWRDVCV